ncbi:MAG: GvpL/GvpF family gas vesicle protein [Deltaproteobacteria bacterium]|nr:GvpL/GvpF family gas vesicle protein [Deltaproteobacteria bacterium]
MGEIAVQGEGRYIYCIIETEGKMERFGPIGVGGRGDEVYTIRFDNIAAVVSNSPIKKYSVARENLIPHECAIEEVMKTHTVLPVRFCTIAEDEGKVRKILEKEHERFLGLLKDIEGKKELGLKAVFKEDAIYGSILADYDEIRMEKEKMAKEPPSAHAHQKLMQIGKMVEAALEEEKAKCKETILSNLEPLALAVKINNAYGERMIINAAFLVEKTKEAAFDQKVNELADKYGDKITFKYVGTLPPFNFVNIEINTGDY